MKNLKGQKGFIRRREFSLSKNKVSTYLTDEELSDMRKIVESMGMNTADFIRLAIDKAIISHKRKLRRDAKKLLR